MQLIIQTPVKSLNKAYFKEKVSRNDIEKFKQNLTLLFNKIQAEYSEDTLKDYITEFLRNTWYNPDYAITINKERKDLAIHIGKTAKEPVAVIAEIKKIDSGEMIRPDKANVKALHELILYYLQERVTLDNNQIKYLLATDVNEWVLFDANEFDKKIYRNTKIRKLYDVYINDKKDNPFFYDELKKILSETEDAIVATIFNLNDYKKIVTNSDKTDDKRLIALYKILSPVHLIKLSFANDSNSLDKNFYTELLHIVGLEEIKDGSKKLIQRKKESTEASLIENAIIKLRDKDCLRDLPDATRFGLTAEEQSYNIALELCITWINRILFLKLLEAQLFAYHKGDKNCLFLNTDQVHDFDELNNLFLQVLAEKPAVRRERLRTKFSNVPYLNSSLFERTELERRTIDISALDNGLPLPLLNTTVLKDDKGKRKTGGLSTLSYLFSFLDSYDFTSEGTAEIQEENKALINASVLGLIFEKINGYKDGSFFTPGFITMYMCRETLRRAVVKKFNETNSWNCQSFEELQGQVEFQDKDKRQQANIVINSLTICDPAVGSGHFLVSALNELIAIKHDLKILQYRYSGQRIREYSIEIVNDELIIEDIETEELFEYTLNQKGNIKPALQDLQETIFHEKEILIESCLFGVDINANSVKICRLRLWIELLKNAYYTKESNYSELETLPNIDINIKQGNSLVSRFALDADLSNTLQNSKWDIESYKLAVQTYRNAESKEEKRAMEDLIDNIKKDFKSSVSWNDPINKKLNKLRGELFNLSQAEGFFADNEKRKTQREQKLKVLSDQIEKLEQQKQEIQNNTIYKEAFEWRFEFPEVLDNEGNFLGFDVVIGNPPYVAKSFDENLRKFIKANYKTSQYQLDLYISFIELSIKLLKNYGKASLITPNSWLKNMMFTECRKYFLENTAIETIIPNMEAVFEEASVDTMIFIVSKKTITENSIEIVHIERQFFEVSHKTNQGDFGSNDRFIFDVEINNASRSIFTKIRQKSTKHDILCDITRGVNPYDKYRGQDEAVIKNKVYHAILKKDATFIPEIRGRHLSEYSYKWDGKSYISYGPWLAAPREMKYFEGERLIMRQVLGKKLVCTIIDEKIIIDQSVFISKVKEEYQNKISSKYILALLASKLYVYYFKFSNNEFDALFPKIKIGEFKELPIYLIDSTQQTRFIEIINIVLAVKKQNPQADTSALEKEIDQLVYKLYELTDEEIKIVESAQS